MSFADESAIRAEYDRLRKLRTFKGATLRMVPLHIVTIPGRGCGGLFFHSGRIQLQLGQSAPEANWKGVLLHELTHAVCDRRRTKGRRLTQAHGSVFKALLTAAAVEAYHIDPSRLVVTVSHGRRNQTKAYSYDDAIQREIKRCLR